MELGLRPSNGQILLLYKQKSSISRNIKKAAFIAWMLFFHHRKTHCAHKIRFELLRRCSEVLLFVPSIQGRSPLGLGLRPYCQTSTSSRETIHKLAGCAQKQILALRPDRKRIHTSRQTASCPRSCVNDSSPPNLPHALISIIRNSTFSSLSVIADRPRLLRPSLRRSIVVARRRYPTQILLQFKLSFGPS